MSPERSTPVKKVDSVSYKIGELARSVGVGVETIRFYERKGLLPEPPRRRAVHHRGYRIYGEQARRRLEFILRAKQLGFSLAEIGSLLELRSSDQAGCQDVREQAVCHLKDVEERLQDLERIRDALMDLIEECGSNNTVEKSACPILFFLESADGHAGEPKR
jgi:Hg(II)-responsive transcriptional regulator